MHDNSENKSAITAEKFIEVAQGSI